jgi:hypothetical protein
MERENAFFDTALLSNVKLCLAQIFLCDSDTAMPGRDGAGSVPLGFALQAHPLRVTAYADFF